ncbi:hypothetical protein FB593_110109 [Rhizobium sp. SJZ105]|nr:hypothetical protein FB593_110109 [Rhizobium sp. SJZ105]
MIRCAFSLTLISEAHKSAYAIHGAATVSRPLSPRLSLSRERVDHTLIKLTHLAELRQLRPRPAPREFAGIHRAGQQASQLTADLNLSIGDFACSFVD